MFQKKKKRTKFDYLDIYVYIYFYKSTEIKRRVKKIFFLNFGKVRILKQIKYKNVIRRNKESLCILAFWWKFPDNYI